MLTKKQVKALIACMSPDSTRPAIHCCYIDTYDGKTAIIATDGYKMVILTDESFSVLEPGTIIPFDSLNVWYKLASAKHFLNAEDISIMCTISEAVYPDYKALLPDDEHKHPISGFGVNGEFVKTLETLSGVPLWFETYGDAQPMIARHNDNIYVLMPRRKPK